MNKMDNNKKSIGDFLVKMILKFLDIPFKMMLFGALVIVVFFNHLLNFEGVKEYFRYPEEEYVYLETEIDKFISSGIVNEEIPYTLDWTKSDIVNRMEIVASEGKANINIVIEDFGSDTQSIKVQREAKSNSIWRNIGLGIGFVCIMLFYALILIFIWMVIISIIGYFLKKIKK